MSVYDKQERKIVFSLASTPVRVGPGCYNLDEEAEFRARKGQKPAPFNTTGAIGSSGADFAGPGPIYKPKITDVDSRHNRVVGGRALANRAPRFVYNTNDMPGPGTYEIMKKTRWLQKGAVSMDPPTIPPPPPEPVKVFVKDPDELQPPKRTTVMKPGRPLSIPSIPDGDRLFGYRINRDGKLTVNKRPDSFPPLYNGDIPKFETEKFHGCKFGARTGLRDTNWAGPPGPAPNSYSPSLPKKKNFIRTQPHLASAWGLMGPDKNYPKKKIYSVQPAPNAYDIRGDIVPLPEGAAPFDQSSRRFVYVYNENPGPGSYETSGGSIGEAATVAPLDFTAKRFVSEIESSPGPSDYRQPDGIADEINKKSELLGSPHGAFGISQGRDFNLGSKQEFPAPNSYNPKAARAGPNPIVTRRLTSSFADRQIKGLDPRFNAGFGNPAPNAYESDKAYSRLKSTRRAEASSNEGKDRQTCFHFHAQRFHDVKNDVPAPCTYDPVIECKCMAKGRFTVHDAKLNSMQNSVGPGPAYFPTNETIGQTNTFNSTLGYAKEPE